MTAVGSILIDNTAGPNRKGEPVLGGIPIARGRLSAGGWFAATSMDGAHHTLEGTPAAWWPDGSVKWLLLCGALDLAGGERSRFELMTGAASPAPGLRCETAGPMIHVLDGDAGTVFGGTAVLMSRTVTGLSAGLVLTDAARARHERWRWRPGEARTVVATANRVVVRMQGPFVSEADTPCCELILFAEVMRGIPELRLQPVFIYTGTPEQDLVRSLTLTVRTTLGGEGAAYAFAEERGPGYSDSVKTFSGQGPRWQEARLLQLGSSFYKIEKRVTASDPWVKAAEGMRSAGWCHLADSSSGLTAAVRNLWREYPRELHIDAARGALTFGLWPADAEPMDFRRYSGTVYGTPVYETANPGYEHIPLRLDGNRWDSRFGALGVAKAHELMLRFHGSTLKAVAVAHRGETARLHVIDPASDVAARACAFTAPCRILSDPAGFAASGVVGKLAALDDRAPSAAEATPRRIGRLVARIAEFVVHEREVRGWYGQYDYGDVQMSFFSNLNRWGYDHGGYAWTNSECLPDYGLWLTALCSGRADWLEAAIDMTRHNRDVDMHHRGPFRGYGSRHNVNHWGCACKEWRISMPLVKRLHYYVTGDPWTREVIDETWRIYEEQPRTLRLAPDAVCAFAAAYVRSEMTGERVDRVRVRRLMDGLADGFAADGRYVKSVHLDLASGNLRLADATAHEEACFFFNKFGGQHALVEAAELLEHGPLLDALVRYARFQLASRLDAFLDLQPVLALAWRRTGESIFREAIEEALREADKAVRFTEQGGSGPTETPRRAILGGLDGANKVMCHPLAVMLNSCPYGLSVGTGVRA